MSKIKNPSKTQQKTLNEILKVASEQFSQSGFEAVSIELIAREANISRATVYNFYNSKDEILEELFGILLQKLRVLENMAEKTPDTVLNALFDTLKTMPEVGFVALNKGKYSYYEIENILEDALDLNRTEPFRKLEHRTFSALNKRVVMDVLWSIFRNCRNESAGSTYFSAYLKSLLYRKKKK